MFFYCLARHTARQMIVKLRYLALSDTCSQRVYLQRARLCASLLTSVIGAFCIVFIGNCPNFGLRYGLLQWKTLLMLGCCLSATPPTLIFERSKLRYILWFIWDSTYLYAALFWCKFEYPIGIRWRFLNKQFSYEKNKLKPWFHRYFNHDFL